MVACNMEFARTLDPWFALRVRPCFERLTATYLRQRDYEEFSPTYTVTRQWSDRKKQTESYLFPGYVFCRFNPHDRLPVLSAPGVIDVVRVGKEPAEVPESEIERVRMMVRSGLPLLPWPHLDVGDLVLLERGPLAGLEGRLERIKDKYRIIVSLSLLRAGVSAEVDRAWVRPLKKAAPGHVR